MATPAGGKRTPSKPAAGTAAAPPLVTSNLAAPPAAASVPLSPLAASAVAAAASGASIVSGDGAARIVVKPVGAVLDANRRALTFHDAAWQSEHNELVAKMAKLKQLSRADRDLIAQLQLKIDEQKRELSGRAVTILDIQKNVDRFAELLKARMDDAEALRHANKKLEQQNDTLNLNLDQKERALTALQAHCDSLQAQCYEQKRKIAELRDERDHDTRSHANRVQQLMADHKSDADALTQRLRIAQTEYERLTRDRASDEEKLSAGHSAAVAEKQSAVDALHAELKAAKASAAAADAAWQRKHSELARLYQDLQHESAGEAARKVTADADAAQHRQAVGQLQAQHESAEQRAQDATEQSLRLAAQLADVQQTAQQTTAVLHDTQLRLRLLTDSLQSVTSTQTSQSEQHKAVVAGYETQLAALTKRVAEHDARTAAHDAERERHWKLALDDAHAAAALARTALQQAHEHALADLKKQLTTTAEDAQRAAADATAQLSDARARATGSSAELERLRALRTATQRTETELQGAVTKLLAAQSAMEGGFTCAACVELFADPVTAVPCGHTVCKKCCVGASGGLSSAKSLGAHGTVKARLTALTCPECKTAVDSLLPNKVLTELEGKFVYSTQVLAQLRKEINKLNAAIAGGGSAVATPRTSGTHSTAPLPAGSATTTATGIPAISPAASSAATATAAASVASPRTTSTPRKFPASALTKPVNPQP